MPPWIKQGVAEVAREVLRERGSGSLAGFPLVVTMQVKRRRSDIWDHVLENWPEVDPHQVLTPYIPQDVTDQLDGIRAGERPD